MHEYSISKACEVSVIEIESSYLQHSKLLTLEIKFLDLVLEFEMSFQQQTATLC